jgi:hypothetical protein
MRAGFEEKKERFIIYQMKRRTGRVNLSEPCCSTSERKCLLFVYLFLNVCLLKKSSWTQFEYVTKHISHNRCWPRLSQFTGATSTKLYVLVDRFTPWWSERGKGEKSAQFNWRVKSINLDLPIMKRERERQTDRRRHRHCKGEKMSV